MAQLDGAVVVVTGADTEGGAASARALAAAGALAVVLCGADGSALGALASELEALGCRSALYIGDVGHVGDVGDTASGASGAGELVEMVHELFLARRREGTEDGEGGDTSAE